MGEKGLMGIKGICAAVVLLVVFVIPKGFVHAQDVDLHKVDTDYDGLSDYDETYVYHTDVYVKDSDGDGYTDGEEVAHNFDPNKATDDKLEKIIRVSLTDQSLAYGLGDYIVTSFKISSGLPGTPTPPGEYNVLVKRPVVDYFGANYSFPNTKWNLMFKRGKSLNYYIHGAYWHNAFGTPKSHGCINVSYTNMEALYDWADVGTKVVIK